MSITYIFNREPKKSASNAHYDNVIAKQAYTYTDDEYKKSTGTAARKYERLLKKQGVTYQHDIAQLRDVKAQMLSDRGAAFKENSLYSSMGQDDFELVHIFEF
jgi:hypothetical protein